jgi:hypothetical protein
MPGPFARWLLRHAGQVMAALAVACVLVVPMAMLGWVRPHSGTLVGAIVASVVGLIALGMWSSWMRERAIREAALPQFLKRKLREAYPHLSGKDADLVERGLRQFFLACARSGRRFVAMPSRAVDAMWHEFILHTRAYRDWCDLALGRFLHHTPAEALGADAQRNDGLRRAWYWACRDEAIDPRAPTRLPLLFALDAKLKIAGGFTYLADCRDILAKSAAGEGSGGVYCGTSFSNGSASGDGDSFGGADSSGDGDGGGDGGGCGGD